MSDGHGCSLSLLLYVIDDKAISREAITTGISTYIQHNGNVEINTNVNIKLQTHECHHFLLWNYLQDSFMVSQNQFLIH